MGVSSIKILSLPDAVDYPEQVSVRPTMEVSWVGDVGPYDVLHEWDTVNTFDSGSLITDSNTGQTSPDTGVPPSDMGGSTWHYRVTVTDTDDSGSLTSSSRTIEFFDDVDVTQHKWWHYLLANVIPGFGSGEIDDPLNANRYLYLLANITTDQPCPWIQSVAPSLQQTGKSITVMGDSFGATPATWGGEVRIYDTPGFGGSSVTLTQTAWSDTEVTATVPIGATSGFVTVVHTTGTPTCSGSNQKFITIEQTPADPEAGWWVEFYDFKNVNKVLFSHTGTQPDIASAQIVPVMNDIGNGFIEIPFGQLELINELIDPENDIASFVRVYLDERYRYGFYTDDSNPPVVDIGAQTVKIAGDGMESVARRGIVRPFDHPAQPTKQPTWIYGSNENFIANPGFEDNVDILSNPGGEDGNDDDGKALGWTGSGTGFTSAVAVNDGLNAFEGDWYIAVDSTKAHSGIEQSVSVTPGKHYHVRVRVQGTTTGQRLTLALGGGDVAAIGITYPNNFAFGGDILAELDNVAQIPSGNGCPGGSTDGTWQVMDVEVLTGSEQTSLTIKIQDDHHGVCSPSVHDQFWVDALTIEGWGLGLSPWKPFQEGNHASDSFRLNPDFVIPGSKYSAEINALVKFAGIEQTISVNPNTKYTFKATGHIIVQASGDIWTLEIARTDTGSLLLQDQITPTAGPETMNFQGILTMPSDVEEVNVRLIYSGSNNPSPIWVDNFSSVPGEPASTPGKIINDILAAIQARGVIDFLDLNSFSDTLDSLGNLWFGLVSLDIEPGSSVYDVLSRFVALGYEWDIVPVNFRAGGDTGVQLNIYNNRSFGSGIGRDQTIDEKESIVLAVGNKAVSGGSHQKRAYTPNVVFAIDQDGNWSEAETSDIAADEAAFGRIERHLNVTAGSVDTLAEFAKTAITEEEEKAFASKYSFTRDDVLRPFLHFGVGDTVFEDPGDNGARRTKRTRSITADLAGEGTDIAYTVDLSRVFFADEAAVLAAINQLLERAPADVTGVGTGSVTTSSTGFIQTVIVGQTTPHTHDLDGAEIRNKVATGDVTGTLPGPLQVGKIQGRRVSGVAPGINDLFVWNAETELWEPRGVPKATIFLLGGM